MMKDLFDFTIKHWLALLFSGFITAVGICYRKISTGIKGERMEQRLMKEALLAILHDRLYSLCKEYINQGEITIEAMENLEYLYKSYSALGGNGTCKKLYERVQALPIKEEK